MKKINLDASKVFDFVSKDEINIIEKKVNLCHNMLHKKTGKGSEYLGWVDLPNTFSQDEIKKIEATANKIKDQSDVFIVVGVGGSYLGARAAVGMLNHIFYNELPKERRNGPKIYFAGYNISSVYLKHLIEIIKEENVSINVISKSGTTTEPALVFRILKEYMENKYGKEEARKRIYATTDEKKGALRELATKEGYETFVIPRAVGGRYSVLTSVGLLPMAVSGIDIKEVIEGAKIAYDELFTPVLEDNPAYQYAAIRNLLYDKGKTIEIMASFEPSLFYFGEWFKQLFGESEGKCGKGIFPTSMNFTTDLHSMGQYIQEGRKNIFETVLYIEKSKEEMIVKEDDDNLDQLNYVAGKSLDFINQKALEGSLNAHLEGNVPSIVINIPEISPFYFGYMVYFFEKACGMSGYLLGVNPFDQPGVEAYKNNMFKLLGKPGYD
ncbi:glucose-6-phosphate isomerase [Inediibacterium massiliense]|uniref:glucose-6-phosphate isomerase n=1 Tax=Inediibacterium massiliense TaxID=1658111 RepID=UPI0006B63A96|nr:glucose-6-phosphate isomerase [Inediibacterium massiliense]